MNYTQMVLYTVGMIKVQPTFEHMYNAFNNYIYPHNNRYTIRQQQLDRKTTYDINYIKRHQNCIYK